MGLDREAEKGVWQFKGQIHKRTGVNNIRLRLKK